MGSGGKPLGPPCGQTREEEEEENSSPVDSRRGGGITGGSVDSEALEKKPGFPERSAGDGLSDGGPPGHGSGGPPDTISLPDTQPPDTQQDTAVIWISNGTGTEDAENAFRPACEGVLLRLSGQVHDPPQNEPGSCQKGGARGSPFHVRPLPAARGFSSADTSMKVSLPTSPYCWERTFTTPASTRNLSTPDGPGDTLYIDIANHGIQYTLEGMGAASWMASKLDGREVTIQGRDWILKVSDIRAGDRLSEEIGIPAALETTTFLYRPGSAVCGELEGIVRSVFQALPAQVQGPPQGVPVPDVHVLMGAP